VDGCRTPAPFIADALGQETAVVVEISLPDVVNFDLTTLLVIVHPSEYQYFGLIRCENKLKRQKFAAKRQRYLSPIFAIVILQKISAEHPDLLSDHTGSGAIMPMYHWWQKNRLLSGTILFTTVRKYLIVGKVASKQIDVVLVFYDGTLTAKQRGRTALLDLSIGCDCESGGRGQIDFPFLVQIARVEQIDDSLMRHWRSQIGQSEFRLL
jgi:hypothetical protein